MSVASFISSVVLSLQNALGVPSTKIPIDGTAFVSYVLPPVVCHIVAALLVITPETRAIRVALWPLIALLALRAALSVEMSLGHPKRKFLNVDLALFMVSIAVNTLGWTLAKKPPVRHLRPANSSPSVVMDALDLASSSRGIGWEWSRGLYIPRETRPVNNRIAFVFYTLISAVAYNLICGALHRAVLTLAPIGVGPVPGGSTIFDETLPFLVRYLRGGMITTLTGFAIYTVLQMGYDASTIPAVLLGQDPAQWPPIFDAPWRATSLGDFWGRRWHQMFRHMFLFSGGRPLSLVFGRAGIVIGAFLSSAVLHYITLVALGSWTEMGRMLIGFGMMAPGILAERAFHQLTGRRVGGVVGWVWTMVWLHLWGSVIAEGFGRAGMFGCAGFVDNLLPVRIPVEKLVADFDAWLHMI